MMFVPEPIINRNEVADLRAELAACYATQAQLLQQRDQAIVLAILLAHALDLPAGITRDDCMPMPEFSCVAAIDLLSGPVSWHLQAQNLLYFRDVPRYHSEVEHCSPKEQARRLLHPFEPNWSEATTEKQPALYAQPTEEIPLLLPALAAIETYPTVLIPTPVTNN